MELNFYDHLRQFFGDEVGEEELRAIAVHAIAADVRNLKPAISQAVWSSRQQSAAGMTQAASADLEQARRLHGMYARALAEFQQITKQTIPADAVAGHDESNGRTEDDSDRTREHR